MRGYGRFGDSNGSGCSEHHPPPPCEPGRVEHQGCCHQEMVSSCPPDYIKIASGPQVGMCTNEAGDVRPPVEKRNPNLPAVGALSSVPPWVLPAAVGVVAGGLLVYVAMK